jgi:hypothetical protein
VLEWEVRRGQGRNYKKGKRSVLKNTQIVIKQFMGILSA